jgi:lysophospholipase
VDNFSDYVDDFARVLAAGSAARPWRKRYILAHSMGGAISTLFLQRYQHSAMPLRSPRRCMAS